MNATTERTAAAAAGWAEGMARTLREYADNMDRIASYAHEIDDADTAGRYVSGLIGSLIDQVVIAAYDVRACSVCGTPAQWHADNDHYPQDWTAVTS